MPAPKLGAVGDQGGRVTIRSQRDDVNEVIMGCVLTAGVGQAPCLPGRAIAGLLNTLLYDTSIRCVAPVEVRDAGSSGDQGGDAEVVVAGGMENMSQPTPDPRFAPRVPFSDAPIADSMVKDGLWDVYNDFHMGNAGELCAREHGFTREQQDEFARGSWAEKAVAAQESGAFTNEIVAIEIPQRRGEPVVVDTDEEPAVVDPTR